MYIKVKVTPKSKKEKIIEVRENHFDIKVKEKAEKNMVNVRIIDILAERFAIDRKKIKIVNGHHSPSKLISIDID